jgi:biopolymer transport protein ExbB/TolQ
MGFVIQEFGFVALLTLVSLLAVFVPLARGVRLCFQARSATRRVASGALKKALSQPSRGRAEPLSLLMLRVLVRSLKSEDQNYASDFVLDASKQYAMHEYESNYAQLISMYANLLPPVGFIGTTTGMLVLFASMHLSDSTLELGALAIALLSSIFALMGFAMLEGMKIRLYGRLLNSLDEVTTLHRSSES